MQYDLIVRRLEEYRRKYNIMQNEMADYLEITQSQYSKLEMGKIKLSYDVLDKVYKYGWDIDLIITGEHSNPVLKSLERVLVESSRKEFVSWLRLCEWAMEQWLDEGRKTSIIGYKLIKTFIYAEKELTPLQKLRLTYGLSQARMAEIVGVNIKKYRQLEKGSINLDAELLANIYEETRCRPLFFMDEETYYLSVISEECRYDSQREEQLNYLLSIKEKFGREK